MRGKEDAMRDNKNMPWGQQVDALKDRSRRERWAKGDIWGKYEMLYVANRRRIRMHLEDSRICHRRHIEDVIRGNWYTCDVSRWSFRSISKRNNWVTLQNDKWHMMNTRRYERITAIHKNRKKLKWEKDDTRGENTMASKKTRCWK